MSLFGKIPEAVEAVKSFDDEKPVVTVESNVRVYIENYKTIRLFTDTEIEINFDEFVMSIRGEALVIKSFTPSAIKITGRILSLSYIGGN